MRFGVLGPTEVWDGDRQVELGPARRRLVLAALLVDAGRVVPTDVLLDRVWDGDPPAAAAGTLQAYISRLRATLAGATHSEPARLTTSPRGYALDVADDDVDARRFTRLVSRAGVRRDDGDLAGARELVAEALGLWRGGPFADFSAEFTAAEAARLVELRTGAVALQAELDLALGRAADVVPVLTPLVAAEPLREPLRETLMLALYRTGRQADALAVYDHGRRRLVDDLGVDPGPALQRLHEQILRQDPALDLAPAQPASPDDVGTPDPAPGAGHDRFVGRDLELRLLADVLRRARAGETAVAAVIGEAGIGKSRLVEDATARARADGWTVAWGRAWQHDGAPALWPWIQVVREVAAAVPPDVLAAATTGAGAAVEILAPELGPSDRAPAFAQQVVPTADGAEAQVFDGVLAFLSAAAAFRPLVVVLDDLQWFDPASRRLTDYLAWRARDTALAVVATVRSPGHDADHPDLQVLADLARLAVVTRIDLPPLSVEDVRAFVVDRMGSEFDAETAAALHTRTGGNPFYVGEIVRLVTSTGVERAVAEGVPDTVRGVIRRRLGALSETDQTVLRTAAVVGRTFDLELLAAVSGLSEDDVDEAVDRATSVGVLRTEPGSSDQHRFTHALLQETLLDETGPSRRARVHRRIAEALVARAIPGSTAAERIAFHFAAAGGEADLDRAVGWYLDGAEQALGHWAYAEALGLLHAATAAAARLTGPTASARQLVSTYRTQAFQLVHEGSIAPPLAALAAEHDPIARLEDPTLSDRDLLTVYQVSWGAAHGLNQLTATNRLRQRMTQIAEERDADVLRLAVGLDWVMDLQQSGGWARASTLAEGLGALITDDRPPVLEFFPHPVVGVPLWRGVIATMTGDAPRSDALFGEAAALAHRVGDPIALAYLDVLDIYRAVWSVQPERALLATERFERNQQVASMRMFRTYAGVAKAWAVSTVDPQRAVVLAAPVIAEQDQAPELAWRPAFRAMWAEILHRAGRTAEGLEYVDLGLTEAARTGAHGFDAHLYRVRAEILRDTGAPGAEIAAAVDAGLAIAREQGAGLFERQLLAVRESVPC